MFLYRNILSQAWKITWRSKYLWFFGLFAALLGNGGELEIVFRGFDGDFKDSLFTGWQFWPEGFFNADTISNIGRLLINDPVSLLSLLLLQEANQINLSL